MSSAYKAWTSSLTGLSRGGKKHAESGKDGSVFGVSKFLIGNLLVCRGSIVSGNTSRCDLLSGPLLLWGRDVSTAKQSDEKNKKSYDLERFVDGCFLSAAGYIPIIFYSGTGYLKCNI